MLWGSPHKQRAVAHPCHCLVVLATASKNRAFIFIFVTAAKPLVNSCINMFHPLSKPSKPGTITTSCGSAFHKSIIMLDWNLWSLLNLLIQWWWALALDGFKKGTEMHSWGTSIYLDEMLSLTSVGESKALQLGGGLTTNAPLLYLAGLTSVNRET